MTTALGYAFLVMSVLAAVPAGFVFVQLVAAALGRAPAVLPRPTAPRTQAIAVLMPAHDEASGITQAIAAVLAGLGDRDRLLVVADNCSDATAAIARAAGAEVTERFDAVRRGKGYALDHGVRWLEKQPPAVVVIVDADCIVAPGALESLARRCASSHRPVQALYLMHAPPAAGLSTRVAEFAWLVKNKLRPLGSAAFGWPCQLMGTGMAFPWAVIRDAPLATGHLVEDMKLGLDLAALGLPPLFEPDALVSSVFPSDPAATRAQRTRWEHGHLSVIAAVGPRMFARAVRRFDVGLAAMALDLMVPPLAAFAIGLVVLFLADVAWGIFAADYRPLVTSVVAIVLFTGGVLIAWYAGGRRLVSGTELLSLPLYVASKVSLYLRLFTRRQVEWVRTKRDDQNR